MVADKVVDANSGGESLWQPRLSSRQRAQFWVPKDAADVCGTYSGGTYPSDAEIPASLYEANSTN